jgi:hypothetical protein
MVVPLPQIATSADELKIDVHFLEFEVSDNCKQKMPEDGIPQVYFYSSPKIFLLYRDPEVWPANL